MSTIPERLEKLRAKMQEKGIDIYIIPTADFHQSEYVGEHFKAREYITGFTGSAGTAVVSKTEARLWTDGRYFIQAAKQLEGTTVELMKMGQPGVPKIGEYLETALAEGETVGFDGRVVSVTEGEEYEKIASEKNGKVVYAYDLIDEVWEDRPILSEEPVFELEQKYTGETVESKLARTRAAMKELGFVDFYDVGLGGDMTAAYEAEEWAEAYKEGQKKVTSCCPAFVNMVRLHYPQLADNISTTVSPMCAISRMIKAQDPEAITVFIGPCLAKKSEVVDQQIEGNADYVLTYSEIRAIMKAKDVELEACPNDNQTASTFGKRFANSGGVTAAVLESLKESDNCIDAKVCRANGSQECKKALLLMKVGRLPEDFIEGMACDGGCVGGPSSFNDQMASKKNRDALISQADDRGILDNLKNYDMDKFSMHRD